MNIIRCADTIGQNLNYLLGLPYWRQRLIASYTTRTYAASPAQFALLGAHGIPIDQAPTNELHGGAKVKDVEPGAAYLHNVVNLALAGHVFVDYVMGSELDAHRAALHAAGVAGRVHFWVANWGFNEQGAINFMAANPDVVGVQWASPSSNPNTVLPGSGGRTLRQTNCDLSVMNADFWLPKSTPPKPAPRNAQGEWHAELIYTPANNAVRVVPRKGKNVKMADHPASRKFSVAVDEQHGHWTAS